MAKKKTVESSDSETPKITAPRRRTTRRPPGAPAPETSAGLDGSPAHEPMTVAAGSSNGQASESQPTYDQIAEAAYHRYLQRGGHHGLDFDDWVEAERSLRSRR